MIPLNKLKEDMQFTRELQDMIEVMKGATVSQFQAFQRKRKGFEAFKIKLEEMISTFDVPVSAHPFLKGSPNLPKAIVMITSDEGFTGGLNALVVNAALEQATSQDDLIVLGERGARYLTENQSSAFTFLQGVGEDITYKRAVAIRDLLISKFLKKQVGGVLIAYPHFLSLTSQKVEVARLLPCSHLFGQSHSQKGHKGMLKILSRESIAKSYCLIEPTPLSVVDYLVKGWMMQKIYDMFWESKLSECAARIIHLEGSHEEITSANKKLVYEYFKHLHSRSDKNIREIFASRLKWR